MIPELMTIANMMLKFVIFPLLGIIGWMGKRYIDRTDAKADKLAKKLDEMDRKLEKEFYDKAEVDRHLDTQIAPLKEQLIEVSTSLKGLVGSVGKMSEDMAILKYAVLGSKFGDKSDHDPR